MYKFSDILNRTDNVKNYKRDNNAGLAEALEAYEKWHEWYLKEGYKGKRCIARCRRGKPKKPVMCVTTGKVYSSGLEAAKDFNLSPASVNNVCRGVNKTCSADRLVFRYLTEKEIERYDFIQ